MLLPRSFLFVTQLLIACFTWLHRFGPLISTAFPPFCILSGAMLTMWQPKVQSCHSKYGLLAIGFKVSTELLHICSLLICSLVLNYSPPLVCIIFLMGLGFHRGKFVILLPRPVFGIQLDGELEYIFYFENAGAYFTGVQLTFRWLRC